MLTSVTNDSKEIQDVVQKALTRALKYVKELSESYDIQEGTITYFMDEQEFTKAILALYVAIQQDLLYKTDSVN